MTIKSLENQCNHIESDEITTQKKLFLICCNRTHKDVKGVVDLRPNYLKSDD
jgi:hypothetical protein